MPISGKELVKKLKAHGWRHVRTQGSHFILAKNDQLISVPVHGNRALGKGLEQKLLKETGLK